jgi:HK97 family phage portal protein
MSRNQQLQKQRRMSPSEVETAQSTFGLVKERFSSAVSALRGKASAFASQMRHYGADGGYGSNFEKFFFSIFGRFMNSGIDYAREVGDLKQSSLVMAAVNWLGRTLPEAPLQVVEKDAGGNLNIIEDHEAALRLQQPNPYYSGELLWMFFSLSWMIDGNVYFWKVRNRQGQVIQIWPLPYYLVEPRWPVGDDSVYISHYAYLINGVEWEIKPEDMIHFRNGIDPQNPRKGLSDFASLLREIFADNEAANCSALIMKNSGVFPFAVSPKEGSVEGDLSKIKEEFVRRTTGDERGKPVVNGVGIEIHKLSFSPKEMDMKMLRRVPEERVASVIGIPASVLGFGAGLDRNTMHNAGEMREAAYESYVIPLHRIIAGQLNLQYLPEFEKNKKRNLRHDLTQVRVLQDDQNKLYTRLSTAYKGGWMKRSEARSRAGLKVETSDDVYFSQATPKQELPPEEDTGTPAKLAA